MLVPASDENVKAAKSYTASIHASGCKRHCSPAGGGGFRALSPPGSHPKSVCPSATNINDAMLMAVELLEKANREELLSSGSVSLIILLTDGDPTAGEGTAHNSRAPGPEGAAGAPPWLAVGSGEGRRSPRPLWLWDSKNIP